MGIAAIVLIVARRPLSEALVARIDVGFNEEETGITYLEFGHMF